MQRKHYDDDQLAFADAVRTFIGKEITPHFLDWEAAGLTPRELFLAAGANGFLGLQVPERVRWRRHRRLPVQPGPR